MVTTRDAAKNIGITDVQVEEPHGENTDGTHDGSMVRKSPWYTSLFLQLLIFIVAGIIVGWLWPEVP